MSSSVLKWSLSIKTPWMGGSSFKLAFIGGISAHNWISTTRANNDVDRSLLGLKKISPLPADLIRTLKHWLFEIWGRGKKDLVMWVVVWMAIALPLSVWSDSKWTSGSCSIHSMLSRFWWEEAWKKDSDSLALLDVVTFPLVCSDHFSISFRFFATMDQIGLFQQSIVREDLWWWVGVASGSLQESQRKWGNLDSFEDLRGIKPGKMEASQKGDDRINSGKETPFSFYGECERGIRGPKFDKGHPTNISKAGEIPGEDLMALQFKAAKSD